MAKHTSTCLVCGRPYTDYDASPKWFCSVACQADSGEVMGDIVELYTGRSRPAKTVRSKKITKVSETPPMKLGEPDCAPIWEEIPKIKK